MTPGTLAHAAMRGVHRYRHSALRQHTSGCCRFSPSCSEYALQALRRRRFPTALLLICWRLLRCTPLTAAGTHDPVRPARRGGAVLAVLTLSGLTTLMVAGTAAAVTTPGAAVPSAMAGGCSAFVGGVNVDALDADHPLQVHKGQRVVLTGTAPPSIRSTSVELTSSTVAKIHFVENLATTTVDENSTGTRFQQSVNVDRYLKYGSGIYRVDARSVARPGWDCSATFYVELNGSKLAAEVAVAVGAVGTVGMVASARGGTPIRPEDIRMTEDGVYDPAIEPEDLEARQRAAEASKDKRRNAAATSTVGCLAAILFALIASTGAFAAAMPATSRGSSASPQRVWVKGHPVLGFFSGLVAGLGITVALQQFGVYPLTAASAIGAPLVMAVLGAARGWRGTAWVFR